MARWQAGCIGVGGGAVVAGFCSLDMGAGERVSLLDRRNGIASIAIKNFHCRARTRRALVLHFNVQVGSANLAKRLFVGRILSLHLKFHTLIARPLYG